MSQKQLTINEDVTYQDRVVPNTIVVCEECGEWMLRSRMQDHEHSEDVFTKLTYTVQVIQQAVFEVDVDALAHPSAEERKEKAQADAVGRYLEHRSNFQPETKFLNDD